MCLPLMNAARSKNDGADLLIKLTKLLGKLLVAQALDTPLVKRLSLLPASVLEQ